MRILLVFIKDYATVLSKLIHSFSHFVGAQTKAKFRNLRKRYTNAKKQFAAVNVSGTSARKVANAKKALEKLGFMQWLDEHIKQRNTKTNVIDESENAEEPESQKLGKLSCY